MPVRSADIAKARPQNEVRATLLAGRGGGFRRCHFLSRGYSRFPELLPFFIIWCQMCHGKPLNSTASKGKSRSKGKQQITPGPALTYRLFMADRTLYVAILTL